MRWVFKNTPASSQPSLHAVYGVGYHTRQIDPFRSQLQRGITQEIFKPQKNAKVRLGWVSEFGRKLPRKFLSCNGGLPGGAEREEADVAVQVPLWALGVPFWALGLEGINPPLLSLSVTPLLHQCYTMPPPVEPLK
jgi:hypothetical protein